MHVIAQTLRAAKVPLPEEFSAIRLSNLANGLSKFAETEDATRRPSLEAAKDVTETEDATRRPSLEAAIGVIAQTLPARAVKEGPAKGTLPAEFSPVHLSNL